MAEENNPLASMLNNTPTDSVSTEEVTENVEEAPTTSVVEDSPVAGPAALVKVQEPGDEAGAVVVAQTANFGEVAGELDADDLIIPRLIQVHGVGDLAQEFDHGSLCINGDVQVMGMADKKNSEEVIFIPIKAQTVYRENFKHNDAETKDSIPREYGTAEEVLANGGKVTKFESGKGFFRKAMNLLLAIELPKDKVAENEELAQYFIDEYGDKAYGLVAMRLAKGAYNSAGKQLNTDYHRVIKRLPGGLPATRYRMVIENQKKGENWVWTPVVKRLPKNNPPELVEFFSSIVS